jgi:hypothetical protein
MKARAWPIAAAFSLLVTFPGCKKEEEPTPLPAFVGITASAGSVVANGTSSVTLTVTDTGGGPVTVTTTRGTFSTGGQTASVTGALGTLTLVTCNAATDTTCAGEAVVTATSASGSSSTSITFGTLASTCPTSCSADPGCAGMTCNLAAGGTGTCSSTTPSTCVAAAACTPNPVGATTETSCEDGQDNDCNLDTDCDDATCDGQQCQTGSPTYLCVSGACTDTTSGLAIEVTPDRTRLPPNGTSSTSVVVAVTGEGAPLPGMDVTISTSLGTLSATTGTTGADGTTTFTFTASSTPGVATLTATVASTITATATITMPGLGSLQIPETFAQHAVMGAKGSGWNELGSIQVQVLDETGNPYPDGLAVRFEHRQLGGSTLGAPLTADTATCTAAAGCVGYLGAVSSGGAAQETGLASAMLQSGTVAGTLTVTATAAVGGVTRSATLPTVAVVGARANGANFSLVCGPRNVPALAETDCAISLVDAPFTCEALLKDRYNNLLGRATQVIFASEAASVGQVATTPAYDPTQDPSSQPDLGVALQIFNTLGAGLPFDVAAVAPEPSVSHGLDGCGTRTHNPRDGVVTLVAVADGEEAFFDTNGNGSYDAGEPFVDLGEPFVDQDDDGARGPGEWFLDVNGDSAYTARNAQWDAMAKIWTQTVVVYTGQPATLAAPASTYLGMRWADSTFADACTATAAAPPFAVHPSQTGPPEVAATSQEYYVVASDMNLNQLDAGTAYQVTVEQGTVEAIYYGFLSYADDLGLFYRYWPCDQTGACASQCRSTGAALPCVMTPSISGFGCGIAASVVITGGSQPDLGGAAVDWSVATPYDVYGTGKTSLAVRRLWGTSTVLP